MAFNLTVVSKKLTFDWTEFATGLVRIGELEVTSVADMVNKIIQKAGGKKIDRLDIFAHGSSSSFTIGSDEIVGMTFSMDIRHPSPLIDIFRRLRNVFSDDGIIVLDVCDVGQSETIITTLAKATNVSVYACAGGVSPNLGIWWGKVVVGRPNGNYQTGVRIPVDPWEGVQS